MRHLILLPKWILSINTVVLISDITHIDKTWKKIKYNERKKIKYNFFVGIFGEIGGSRQLKINEKYRTGKNGIKSLHEGLTCNGALNQTYDNAIEYFDERSSDFFKYRSYLLQYRLILR